MKQRELLLPSGQRVTGFITEAQGVGADREFGKSNSYQTLGLVKDEVNRNLVKSQLITAAVK